MTAEIAVLNKSAVALATDSAVTIASGQREEKIFDSGDKLFELCSGNAIGVMIYNNMQFVDLPLPEVIKEFRINCPHFKSVFDASDAFIKYLDKIGQDASERVKIDGVVKHVEPVALALDRRMRSKVFDLLSRAKSDVSEAQIDKVVDESISTLERNYWAPAKG